MSEQEPPGGKPFPEPRPGQQILEVISTIQGNPRVVYEAVSQRLHLGGTDTSVPIVRNRLRHRIDFEGAAAVVPRWINTDGVLSIANELMSPDMWLGWIQKSADITTSHPVIDHQDRELEDRSTATSITINNAQFYTSAVALSLLAAGTGLGIERCMPEESTETNIAKAAIAIGVRFETPAETPEIFIERVRELLPETHQKPDKEDPNTLFDYLLAYDAFENPMRRTHCPAQLLTQQMFEEWGRSLATDDAYIERFKGTVTRT